MIDRLSSEFLDAYNGAGSTIKKGEDTHRKTEANKVLVQYGFSTSTTRRVRASFR